MKLAIVLVILVVGSVIFHFASPWWFTPLAADWGAIDTTINITFWVTGFVFIAVNFFLAYVVYRYRYDKNRKSDYDPENKPLELWLTIITTVGIFAMLTPGLFVWAKFVNPPDDAAVVEVVGQQWQWGFRFPGKDNVLGKTHARFTSEKNPFGLDPDDMLGQDDIIVDNNDLHLPINQSVKVLLRSKDVLHNFAVPQFRVKMDLVPGLITNVWFKPTQIGAFDILCMELCGVAHFAMRGRVVVDEQKDFEQWLAARPTFAETQNQTLGDPKIGQVLYAICSGCHQKNGEGNGALNAPKLAMQSSKYLIRQLHYYKQGVRGAHEQDEYGKQMANMAAVLADDAAINHVVSYIATLGNGDSEREKPSITSGNIDSGKSLFRKCSVCHGHQGEGNNALNAPRLAGLQDWYLKRQLLNYKNEVRGKHEHDNFGKQMMLMANMLNSEQQIDDIVTYINRL
ncbi:MAG: cytochrome c oxidase subunit II [Alteromonadaceae bacterium]|nr:MAG: cytochrome c oxidase subunit II [Alteromonadaceae bacterium]